MVCKNNIKESRHQTAQNWGTVELSRRHFMWISASFAAANLIGCGVHQRQNDDFSFLDTTSLANEKTTLDFILRNFNPIGPQHPVNVGSEQFEAIDSIKDSLVDEMSKFGLSDNYRLYGMYQYFGIPEKEKILESYERYFRLAVDLLYSKIRGLRPIDLNFVLVSDSRSHETDFEGKIFLANSCYELLFPKLFDADRDEEVVLPFEIPVGVKPFFGGIYFRSDNKSLKPYIIGTIGPWGLTTPFSEILPYSTENLPSLLEYKSTEGIFAALQLEEALHEGLAYILMENNYLGAPNIERHLSHFSSEMESLKRYSLVPRSIKLVRKVGIQEAFDMFIDSPARFRSELDKV